MDSKLEMSTTEYCAALRQYLYAFILRCFQHLYPHTPFQPHWYIEVIAAKLEACLQGKIRRLIINIPPRHLKSLCASIALVAWLLGRDPAAQVMCVSYAQDLSDKLARDCRSVMTSDWYKSLFPGTRLSTQRPSIQELITASQGFRFATSVGGVLTGRGANIIIIDDPLKPDEALSDTLRKGVNEWYDNTLYSRLNDKLNGRIILIMQRLHENDLVGHVLEQEDWDVLRFPAIAEEDEVHLVETPFGPRRFTRRAGEVLHPDREPREVLDNIRRTLGEYHWPGQYQQAPAPAGGGLVKEVWFGIYEPRDLPERFDMVVQSWDTANKVSELSDFSVCTTWGIRGQKIYLLHVLRKRMEYPDLKRAVQAQAHAYGGTVVLIEDRASGTQLVQELVREGLHMVKACKPEHDKVMRFHAQTAMIENGFVFLPREAPWRAEYLHEITIFPKTKHDDQADSTSQALAWISLAGRRDASYELMRRQQAYLLVDRGLSLDAVADAVKAAPEEVQRWLDAKRARERAAAARRVPREPCAECRQDLGDNSLRIQRGGVEYHPECHKRKFG
jgi:predicted phage terminase large subunit-like protein